MGEPMKGWQAEFKKRFNDDMFTGSIPNIFLAMNAAIAKAKSTDPV